MEFVVAPTIPPTHPKGAHVSAASEQSLPLLELFDLGLLKSSDELLF
jgi:hypothetical protein